MDSNTTNQGTAMQKAPATKPDALATVELNKFTALSLRDIEKMAGIFIESGFFPDLKKAAQAMVKIIAGQELGFSPMVSMTGIHFFQNKIEFSSTLKASLIKGSGKYDYKVIDHTNDRCEIAFFQKRGGEWVSCGVPVVYTWQDATAAGLTNKDNWKKFRSDMLFAACIRQGQRRYCADVLHGLGDEQDGEYADTVDAQAIENAKAEGMTVDAEHVETLPSGEQVDTKTGEIIDVEPEPAEDADAKAEREAISAEEPLFSGGEENLVDLRTAAADAYNSCKGEARKRANDWLGDKTLGTLDARELKGFIDAFANM